jgi:NAD(P)-dependent dehydrogenase (short-subunit alcohol dehydrogenase family)
MSTALVTGAGQGIGRGIAQALAAEGFDVVAADIDPAQAERTAVDVGGRAVHMDVSDPASVTAAVAGIETLDVLVNNAGIVRPGPLADVRVEDFNAVMGVNVLGLILTTQACTEALAAGYGGAVINLASMSARFITPNTGIYPATKAAVVALTQSWAFELAARRIRVNAVAPGRIRTEGTASRQQDPERERRTNELIPLGRSGEPDDIGQVVCFLASDRARYVTGQTLLVDGGLTLGTIAFFSDAQGTSSAGT